MAAQPWDDLQPLQPAQATGCDYFPAGRTSQSFQEGKMLLKIYEENDGLLNT